MEQTNVINRFKALVKHEDKLTPAARKQGDAIIASAFARGEEIAGIKLQMITDDESFKIHVGGE